MLVVGAAQGFCGAYPEHIGEVAHSGDNRARNGTRGRSANADGRHAVVPPGLPVLWSADLPGSSRSHSRARQPHDRCPGGAIAPLSRPDPRPDRVVPMVAMPPNVSRLFPPEPPEGVTSQIAPLMTLPADRPPDRPPPGSPVRQRRPRDDAGRRDRGPRARGGHGESPEQSPFTRRTDVEQAYQQARQEQMTTEVIELSASRT
jgi:F-type H+-transporting ATPase subunit gamma